jgi:hypothetical protein
MDNPYIDASGNKIWYLNYARHRTDGPAVEWSDGGTDWWVNGQRHRTDGPAVEYPDGGKSWWLNAQVYTFDKWLDLNPDLTHEQKVIMKLQYG